MSDAVNWAFLDQAWVVGGHPKTDQGCRGRGARAQRQTEGFWSVATAIAATVASGRVRLAKTTLTAFRLAMTSLRTPSSNNESACDPPATFVQVGDYLRTTSVS